MVDYFAGAGACHKAFSHQLRSEKKVSQNGLQFYLDRSLLFFVGFWHVSATCYPEDIHDCLGNENLKALGHPVAILLP